MDHGEAREILETELAKYRWWSYDQLRALVGDPKISLEVAGRSGARYQVEIRAFWDAKPEGDVRVVGCIDDGGWRAFLPLSDSFVRTRGE